MAQKLNINETPGLFMPTVHFSQGDIGRQFLFEIVSEDGYTIPSGATVTCVGTKPSGFGFTAPCTVDGNTVTLVATDDEGAVFTDEAGDFRAEIRITSGDTVIGTANFVMSSETNPHPDGTIDGEKGSIVPVLTELVLRIESAAADVDAKYPDILQAKTDAENAAQAAAQSATNAAGSATDAAGSATAAENSKSDAEAFAEQAEGYAESINPSNFAPAILETAQGSIASFTDGADDIPVKSLTVDIEPVQSGSGDPSPSNVRPISGWTGCNVSVAGINQFDEDTAFANLGLAEQSDGSWYIANPSSIAIGTPVWENKANYQGQLFIRYTYKTANSTGSQGTRFTVTYTDGTSGTFYADNSTSYVDFESATGSGKIVEKISWDYGSAANSTWFKDFSINYPSTDHDYHAYNGETHTISFASAGTVYGGRLDVTSGVLTVEWVGKDMGQISDWNINSTYNVFYCYLTSPLKKPGQLNLKCQQYTAKETNYMGLADGEMCGTTTGEGINIKDDRYTTVASFKTAVDGIPIVYELDTPQTYQLTPTEVKTLLGNNNIWADTGDVTVEYVADTKTFIEGLING